MKGLKKKKDVKTKQKQETFIFLLLFLIGHNSMIGMWWSGFFWGWQVYLCVTISRKGH